MSKKWFRARKYGFGWTPKTWQGYLIVLFYIGFLVQEFRVIDAHSHSVSDTLYGLVIPFFVATFIFLLICYITGEKLK